MKQLMLLFVAFALLGGSALAQEVRPSMAKDDSTHSWHGYLVDAKSAPELVKNADMAMKNAAEYSKETAMKSENRASGYGIITAGKWLKFDKGGNEQVASFLKSTKQEKGLMVTVNGKLDGDILVVTSIQEVPPPVSSPEVR